MPGLVHLLLLALFPAELANVTSVIDGDTLVTDLGRVRLLGINAPERGQACYREASELLRNMTLGRTVRLEREFVNKDRYGRLLRYVYANGTDISRLLVEKGLAKSYFFWPNIVRRKELEKTESEAIERGQGCMWKRSETGCVQVRDVDADSELAFLENKCRADLDLSGWWLEDRGNNRIYLDVVLCGGCTARVGSFCGRSGYQCSIWSKHDAAYLFAPDGLVDYKKW